MAEERILLKEGRNWPPHYCPTGRDERTLLMWCEWDGTPLTKVEEIVVQNVTAHVFEIALYEAQAERAAQGNC